jgi:23S rRNA pseudouridine1911/1915/1917 synthase
MRLDKYLIATHPGTSRRQALRAIEGGQVMVNGVVVREPGSLVDDESVLDWNPNRPVVRLVRLGIPILHQDEDLVVVDKPAGLLSVPTDAGDSDESALALVREWARRGGTPSRWAERVHRLDRDTSGGLLFALRPEARSALIELFASHRIDRRYVTLVARAPRDDRGEIDAPIRSEWRDGRRGIARPEEESLPALTRWRVLRRLGRSALLEVELFTGRQHQIRAHLAHAGFPVLGDPVYGSGAEASLRIPRLMLHARTLALTNPLTQRHIEVQSPIPGDMAEVLRLLEGGHDTPGPKARTRPGRR